MNLYDQETKICRLRRAEKALDDAANLAWGHVGWLMAYQRGDLNQLELDQIALWKWEACLLWNKFLKVGRSRSNLEYLVARR